MIDCMASTKQRNQYKGFVVLWLSTTPTYSKPNRVENSSGLFQDVRTISAFARSPQENDFLQYNKRDLNCLSLVKKPNNRLPCNVPLILTSNIWAQFRHPMIRAWVMSVWLKESYSYQLHAFNKLQISAWVKEKAFMEMGVSVCLKKTLSRKCMKQLKVCNTTRKCRHKF
jgi:hypothetical protein